MNILTAFVDASNVYSSSLEELNGLRGDNGTHATARTRALATKLTENASLG